MSVVYILSKNTCCSLNVETKGPLLVGMSFVHILSVCRPSFFLFRLGHLAGGTSACHEAFPIVRAFLGCLPSRIHVPPALVFGGNWLLCCWDCLFADRAPLPAPLLPESKSFK